MKSETRAAPLGRRILAQSRYETVAMLRNGEQLTLAIVLPVLALIALTVTPILDGLGSSRINLAAPGILALCAMSTAFTGQGIATGFDRRYGVLRYFSTTPLGRSGLISGKVVAVLAVLVIQVAVVGTLAFILGWQPNPLGLIGAVPLLVLGALAFSALGLLIAGTARPEATLAIANLLLILFGALGGIALPTSKLPLLFQDIVHLLPSGALGNAARAALIHGQWDIFSTVVLLVWALACTVAAIKWFKWS